MLSPDTLPAHSQTVGNKRCQPNKTANNRAQSCVLTGDDSLIGLYRQKLKIVWSGVDSLTGQHIPQPYKRQDALTVWMRKYAAYL